MKVKCLNYCVEEMMNKLHPNINTETEFCRISSNETRSLQNIQGLAKKKCKNHLKNIYIYKMNMQKLRG